MDASEAVQWLFHGVTLATVLAVVVAWLVGARRGLW